MIQQDHFRRLVLIVSLLLLLLKGHQLNALKIPQDVEILDGYEFDDSAEYYPTDADYYEARHFIAGLQKSVRNKRSTLDYDNAKKALAESTDNAHSEPQAVTALKGGDDETTMARRRPVQNVDSRQIEEVRDRKVRRDRENAEYLPKAERQIMDPDYDYYSQRHNPTWSDLSSNGPVSGNAAETAGTARKAKNDGDGDDHDDGDDDDIQAQASSNLVGRGRQARVNFITQPQKDFSVNGEVSDGREAKIPLSKLPFYESKYRLAFPSYNYEMYPSRSYDPYLRRYDRFDEQYPRFDPYSYEDHYLYRRHYDPYDSYSPRVPRYPEPFYNYPDRHYDIPEPRDYTTSVQNNELSYDHVASYTATKYPATVYAVSPKHSNGYPLNPYAKQPVYVSSSNPSTKHPDYQPPQRPQPPKSYSSYPRNQRRIIYYAHLPEIVRTPYDFPVRYNRDRYDGGRSTTDRDISTGVYKTNKESGKPLSGSGNVIGGAAAGSGSDHGSYEYTKHDKNNYPTPKPNLSNSTTRQ